MGDPVVISPWAGWMDWTIKGLVAGLLGTISWLYRLTHRRIDRIKAVAEASEKRIIVLEAQQQNNSEAWRSIHEDILRIERKMDEKFSTFETVNQKFWEQIIALNKEQNRHDFR